MSKKKILLGGFWGRGNCGDEAMLQCQYEFFRDKYEIGILVDEYGAYDQFWNWYPYNLCLPLHHQGSIDHFCSDAIAALHIGGGGLSVGFLANQALKAMYQNIPVIMSGVDLWDEDEVGAVGKYLSCFKYVASRNFDKFPVQYDYLRSMTHIELGADWAFGLQTDEYPAITNDIYRALIVIRELPHEMVADEYTNRIMLHLETIKLAGLKPIFIPFCPEDVTFLKMLGLVDRFPIVELWNNPRRMQQYIMNSGIVISYGRLHGNTP